MKNTITQQLRNFGFTTKQIKKIHNHVSYRGSPFYRLDRVEYHSEYNEYWFVPKDEYVDYGILACCFDGLL